MNSKLLIGLASGACLGGMWVLSMVYKALADAYQNAGTITVTEYSWFFRLLLNCFGYATILVPGVILFKFLHSINYFDKPMPNSCLPRVLYSCFADPGERLPDTVKPKEPETPTREGLRLLFCFVGLMGSYLIWGLLQEKIMTTNYVMPDGSVVIFRDSQFLVFINRLAAFLVALARLLWTRKTAIVAPLYKFSYCSVTNIISAWCQYEALKYVSFPTQVLSKSCKVIPVMLMGRAVSGSRYELYEYVTALLISVGMLLFMFGANDRHTTSSVSTASGLALLALYLAADSFTSSWQGAVFARHAPPAPLAMCAVNLFSSVLSAAALAPLATTAASAALLQRNPVFLTDCLLLSASSTVGQLFIFHTIAQFGAVVFTIIMTLRQALSILASCAVYGHRVSAGGAAGVALVFAAALLRVYCRQRLRARRRRAEPA